MVISANGNDPVTVAVAKKAGSEFVNARSKIFPLTSGSVAGTGGFDMPCKQILHYNCPTWTGNNEQVCAKVKVEIIPQN